MTFIINCLKNYFVIADKYCTYKNNLKILFSVIIIEILLLCCDYAVISGPREPTKNSYTKHILSDVCVCVTMSDKVRVRI